MGPFETAGGETHTYGHVARKNSSAFFDLLCAWLHCYDTQPAVWGFTVQAGASPEWSPWELDEAYRYPSKEAARAACDAYVAALYLSGEVREVVVTISIDPVSGP